MYENVLIIDVGVAVVQYSSKGHTGMITGGLRFGLCAKRERECGGAPRGDKEAEEMKWVGR